MIKYNIAVYYLRKYGFIQPNSYSTNTNKKSKLRKYSRKELMEEFKLQELNGQVGIKDKIWRL